MSSSTNGKRDSKTHGLQLSTITFLPLYIYIYILFSLSFKYFKILCWIFWPVAEPGAGGAMAPLTYDTKKIYQYKFIILFIYTKEEYNKNLVTYTY